VIPGLINTHAHLAQSLLRGLAEDLDLHSWLCDAIWPLEACYEGEDGYVAARLTIAEMLKTGTTCFLEAMLTHRAGIENVVRAVGEMGIRACLVSFSFTTNIVSAAAPFYLAFFMRFCILDVYLLTHTQGQARQTHRNQPHPQPHRRPRPRRNLHVPLLRPNRPLRAPSNS
jgi:hypothetical protein